MLTAREWKNYYSAERQALGSPGLERLIHAAPRLACPENGALIFPHTKLSASGELIAAAALAAVHSRRDEVVMLGVLHGARTIDRERVKRARSGDAECLKQLRRVHGPELAGDEKIWSEEFSLDAFTELVELAARLEGVRAPKLLAHYPFLVGADPLTLPGLDELKSRVRGGAGIVATTDPVHYGVGYGAESTLARTSPEAAAFATAAIEKQFACLAERNYAEFLKQCETARSDFRDPGPVLAEIRGGSRALKLRIHELRLVNYADTLNAPEPTWVAGALMTLSADTLHQKLPD